MCRANRACNTMHDAEDRLAGFSRENVELQTWTLSNLGKWDAYSGEELAGVVLKPFVRPRHIMCFALKNLRTIRCLAFLDPKVQGGCTSNRISLKVAFQIN